MALQSMRFEVRSRKLSNVVIGWVTKNLLSRAPPCLGRHVKPLIPVIQSLAPTNPHWARVVSYGPFSLCVIHKEGLCPSSGDINRLMMYVRVLIMWGTDDAGGKGVEHIEGVALLRVDDGQRVVGPWAQHGRLHHAHLTA
jgi:hypothetical protein